MSEIYDPLRDTLRPDVAQRLEQMSKIRYLNVQRQRVRDMHRILDNAGLGAPAMGQYPGKRVPTYISRWFGPIPLTTCRREATVVSGAAGNVTFVAEVPGVSLASITRTVGNFLSEGFVPGMQVVIQGDLLANPNWNNGLFTLATVTALVMEFVAGSVIFAEGPAAIPVTLYSYPASEQFATLVQPSEYILPKIPFQIPTDYAFEWHGVHAAATFSWMWKHALPDEIDVFNVGFDGLYHSTSSMFTPALVAPQDNKSFLDSVLDANGGGQWLLNFSGFALAENNFGNGCGAPKLCWEMELYDKKRGRSLTEGPVPAEAFSPGAWGIKPIDDRSFFDLDTEVEPRLYVRESRVSNLVDDPTIFPSLNNTRIIDNTRASMFLNVVFTGVLVREVAGEVAG